MPTNYIDGATIKGTDYELHDPRTDSKAEQDGSYANLTAGNAEQLVSTVGIEDKVPYNFRTSGGTADIGDRLTEKIVGGTVAWNQLNKNDANKKIHNGVTFTTDENGIMSITGTPTERAYCYSEKVINMDVIVGHVFLSLIQIISGTVPTGMWFGGSYYSSVSPQKWQGQWSSSKLNAIFKIPNGCVAMSRTLYDITADAVTTLDGASVDFKVRSQLFDLTQMFGSTIADYIYSLEQANAGAGVAWFRHLFPKPYYEYNAGELMSVQAASHITRGFNAWDEEWEKGQYNTQTGEKQASNNHIRCKNLIRVLPNTSYYYETSGYNINVCYFDINMGFIGNFNSVHDVARTTPANCYYIGFNMAQAYGLTYKNDICINLSWDGERDGEYEPYVKYTYPLDDSLTLRGIPKLDSNNSLYYDGDTYEADGTVTRKYGVVDLGSLTWDYASNYQCFISTSFTGAKNVDSYYVPNAICNGYLAGSWNPVATDVTKDKMFCMLPGYNQLRVRDTAFTDATAFKTAMSGVYLVYELAEPTTESADPFQSPQIVNDFGTEEYVDAGVTAETRDVAIPVGHVTQYQNNLRAKLEMAPDSPDGDGDYVVRQTNGENNYVPLVIPTELPTNPSENGTYVLKATVSDGTTVLSWEVQA